MRIVAKLVNMATGSSRLYERIIVKRAPIILEAATGFGVNLGLLTGVVETLGGLVVSLDVDEKAVAKTKSRLGSGRVEFLVSDLTRMPFRDHSFDYIVCHTTMHHLSNIEDGVAEMRRSLKANGALLLIDLNPLVILHNPRGLLLSKNRTLNSARSMFKHVEIENGLVAYRLVAVK